MHCRSYAKRPAISQGILRISKVLPDPQTPLQFVKGVGPYLSKSLAKLGLYKGEDLWYFFPRRYEDRRAIPLISSREIGVAITLMGRIHAIEEALTKGGQSVVRVRLHDQTGSIDAIWFNQPFVKKSLKIGFRALVYGKVTFNSYMSVWEIGVSEYEIAAEDHYQEAFALGSVVPVYRSVAGLSPKVIRQLTKQFITPTLHQTVQDYFSENDQKKWGLCRLSEAIYALHFPIDKAVFRRAKYRIIFEDFFFFQLSLAIQRVVWKKVSNAPKLSPQGELRENYIKKLPYKLTHDQQAAIEKIDEDLVKSTRMNRLLQGDVGCGKTEVAMMTLLAAIQSGYSAAIMAPTEILAKQHYEKLIRQLGEAFTEIIFLSGSVSKKERQKRVMSLLEATPKIIVGTHALLEADVKIPTLGVVIIDEQHRFGVHQRNALQDKGVFPHCLHMTATPIPRSLMLTCFGDLDKTIMTEMPPGREKIETEVVSPSAINKVWAQVKKVVSEGHQVYLVYPLVEESEKMDLQSAVDAATQLQGYFEGVGLLHGKMKPKEKQEVMERFKAGDIKILVSTTVIEVGIDVPNATLMVIQHAERFGLSQLHQLRGRVGRGANAGYCLLVPTFSAQIHNPRLKAMENSTDGFQLAEMDLVLRGPGDLMGKRQSGLPQFRLADLARDEAILREARKAAFAIIVEDPFLKKPQNNLMRRELEKRFPEAVFPN